MADTDVRASRNEGGSSAKSYKDKLLQPSDKDELSVPDQPEIPTLPPTKDEGSPPMTVPVEAPAGADESARDDSTTDGGFIPVDGKGAAASSAGGGAAAGDDDTAGASQIPVPDTSDVTAVAGTELSDLEKEVIGDPSTADLLAAAAADDDSPAANDAPVQANVTTIQDEESSDVTAAAATAGGEKAPAAADDGAAVPADSGVAAGYGNLQQAPAAADDPAAVPAAADLPPGSSSSDGSSDVAAAPTEVKPAEVPSEPAVSADKDDEVVSDAAAGNGAAAAEPDEGSSENPLAAAVEAVAQPMAAALTNLKDVFIGPDINLGGESESTEEKQE